MFVFIKTSSEDEDERRLQDECLLGTSLKELPRSCTACKNHRQLVTSVVNFAVNKK